MAPVPSTPVYNASTSNTSKPSASSDTITNTVFGLCAVIIGVLTVLQGRQLWKLRRNNTHDSLSLHHDQDHHLAELDASAASPQGHEIPQPAQDLERLASADDHPTRTPISGQSSWSDGPSIDSSTAREDNTPTASSGRVCGSPSGTLVDRTPNVTDLAQDYTDPIPYNDFPIAHSADQSSSPRYIVTQRSMVGASARRYSAPGATAQSRY